MEINNQIEALEEEVSVLKNEVRNILQDIRSAVLTSESPLTPETAPPIFRPVEREPGENVDTDEAPAYSSFGSETPGQSYGPAPAPFQPRPQYESPQGWTLSTIASLITWIDETNARLGGTRLRMLLDLANFAGLISEEAQEVITKASDVASASAEGGTASVNDVLVAVRQLESIFRQAEGEPVALGKRQRA